ncbi:MAG: alpha-D-ribose 1-methylphosphonate 5-triphosphate synthase subunit PhnL [Oleiphilaceae bacterium]|jgi:alpha-D-ribose 1-methylphosphonate 5-triphosphate synthase subunit PhnL
MNSPSATASVPDVTTLIGVPRLEVKNLKKEFILHLQNKTRLSVFNDLSVTVHAGECVVLVGPSGMGKSSLLKCVYGNYHINGGHILLHFDDGELDIAQADARWIYSLRKHSIGYVSQFLRVLPRIPAIDIVMEPLLLQGVDRNEAKGKAEKMLSRLNIPQRLWCLSPTTFSGGEQQRINIAQSFIADFPVLLLDEPTASLDAKNREVVVALILEAKAKGAAILGIFHDEEVRDQVADELIDLAENAA